MQRKFLLLAAFTLLIANHLFAQCSAACSGSIDIDNSCISATCYGTDYTDIATIPPFNVAHTTVTIGNNNFTNVTGLTVTNITIKDNTNALVISGLTTSSFNASVYSSGTSITFADGASTVTISGTPSATFLGYTFQFTVSVMNGATTLATRNYQFTIAKASSIVGDPHITTPDSVRYDFQSAGEFVALKGDSGSDFQIQTRHTPVATNGPGHDGYTGITSCVSLITAVAAQVGSHRISYEPNVNGVPDSSSMQLRVDGTLKTLDANGIDLGSGGRITKAAAGAGIEVDFPNGASLVVTSNWWSSYSVWYLNVQIYNNPATKGIMGLIAPRSWLPKLPDGSSAGPMPKGLHDRFTTEYGKFANAWRVTDKTTLFDYAPGNSTATFTKNWPVENPQTCAVQGQQPSQTIIGLQAAQQLTAAIVDPGLKANAIFDIVLTGDPIFAKGYIVSQQVQSGTTSTTVRASKDSTNPGEAVTFTATVAPKFAASAAAPTGSVEFSIDGEKQPQIALDATGHAAFTTTSLKNGTHQITATYTPGAGSSSLSGTSSAIAHVVASGSGGSGSEGSSILRHWWFWLIIIIIIIIIWRSASKKK